MDHPWRKRGELFNGKDEIEGAPRPRSGTEIDELLKNWEECPTPGKKLPKVDPLLGVWKARSVFHDLEYPSSGSTFGRFFPGAGHSSQFFNSSSISLSLIHI